MELIIKQLTSYKSNGDNDGRGYKIRDSWIVYADSVQNELQFYEDENGEVAYGRNINFESGSKSLLIQPDVTFFDSNDNPILLIEIAATHKVDPYKILKIRSLGIDTVEVSIPRDSEKEIEKTFFVTSRTNWIYNYEREQAPYIPTSERESEGILLANEFEREHLRAIESYKCRKTQLKDLIRGINKCMDSEQYRKFEESIRLEIQQVEDNTERNQIRLRELEEKHKRAIREEFRMEEESLEAEERRLAEEIRNYESRYNRKRESLIEFQNNYRPECQQEIERIEEDLKRLGTSPRSYEERMEEIRREEEKIEQSYQSEIDNIEESSRREKSEIVEFENRRAELPEKYRRIEEGIRYDIRELENRRKSLSEKYREIEEGIRADFKELENRVRREFKDEESRTETQFEKDRRESIEAIMSRDCQRVPELNGRIEDVLNARGNLTYIIKEGENLRRLQKIREEFMLGTWKNWRNH